MAREQRWASNSQEAKAREERALATERDRIVRNNSVANDIRLNLPVSVQMPDGEEHFSKPNPRLLPYDTRSEIQRPYIKPPPNVCCTPDWNDSIGPSPCSCGPVSQSVPKCGSSGQHSGGWSLSWSRSSKSPPSSHSRHRCQRHSHPHPSNPSSNSRHSTANSLGSKQKSSLGPQPNVGSGSDKSHNNTVLCKGPTSGPSITERLQNTLTEKVHHSMSASGGSTRTSPNNNSSMSGVFARLVDEPLFSSITSRDSKRNGKCKKSSRNEPSATNRTSSSPSETNFIAQQQGHNNISDVRDVNVSRGGGLNSRTRVPLLPENQPTATSCTSAYSSQSKSSSEDGESSDEKTRNDDNNGNARVPPVIGRHCGGDNFQEILVEHQSSFSGNGGHHTSFSDEDGRGSYSKNVSSTTDSSLYHLNMHPRYGSALSESIKETAHSELSETYDTANQLSDQYCSAEIASTSSICSSGQSKDVRSLRDVT